MTLGKLLNLSELELPSLSMRMIIITPPKGLVRVKRNPGCKAFSTEPGVEQKIIFSLIGGKIRNLQRVSLHRKHPQRTEQHCKRKPKFWGNMSYYCYSASTENRCGLEGVCGVLGVEGEIALHQQDTWARVPTLPFCT